MKEIWEWPRAIVVDHYDGDTLYCDVDMGLGIIRKRQSIRLAGLNAPELKPLQPGAREALALLKEHLPLGEKVSLSSVGYDKYGGRVDAIIERTRDKLNVNKAMLDSGLVEKRDYT